MHAFQRSRRKLPSQTGMQERWLQMLPPLQRHQWLYAFSLPYRVVRMVHTTALSSFQLLSLEEKAGASMVARDSATLHPARRAGTCEAWAGRATRFRNFFVACR